MSGGPSADECWASFDPARCCAVALGRDESFFCSYECTASASDGCTCSDCRLRPRTICMIVFAGALVLFLLLWCVFGSWRRRARRPTSRSEPTIQVIATATQVDRQQQKDPWQMKVGRI